MTFKEKIDRILEANELGINSISAFEDKIEAGRGAINDFYKENREPGRITLKRIKSFPDLNWEWWETGKGEIFLTSVPNTTDNKKNSYLREGVYQTIVEGHTEYVLIPRTVLNETQLVSTEQINKTWAELAEKNKELERKNKQLDFYQEQFARLMDNLELTPKPPKPKEV